MGMLLRRYHNIPAESVKIKTETAGKTETVKKVRKNDKK